MCATTTTDLCACCKRIDMTDRAGLCAACRKLAVEYADESDCGIRCDDCYSAVAAGDYVYDRPAGESRCGMREWPDAVLCERCAEGSWRLKGRELPACDCPPCVARRLARAA